MIVRHHVPIFPRRTRGAAPTESSALEGPAAWTWPTPISRPSSTAADDVAGGEGPSVVLLDGPAGTPFVWHRVLPVLRARGVQPRIVKRPENAMTSPQVGGPITAVTDVAQLLAEQGGTAVVVGYSLGAGTALAVAASAPHQVRALVLVAPAAGLQPIGIADRLLAAPIAGPVVACVGFRMVALALHVPALRRRILVTRGGQCASDAEHVVRHLASTSTWRTFLSAQRCLVSDHRGRHEQLSRIDCPIVIVDGTYDRAVARRIGATLRGLLPSSELVSSSAAGHLIPIDDPDSVAEAVLRALRREYRNSPRSSGC